MLNSVKTVNDTLTYNITSLPVSPESFLSQSGGILGLEWSYSKDNEQLHLFADPVHTPHLPDSVSVISTCRDLNNISCYSLVSKRASFLPFHMNYRESIWETIKKQLGSTELHVFFQLVLKKRFSQEWQPKLQKQYNSYLEGIDFPSTNKLFLSLQYKLLEFVKKTDEWVGRNIEIVGAENKYFEEGFTSELRFYVQGGTIDSRRIAANRIYTSLTVLNHANKWTLLLEKNQSKFIEDVQLRRLPLGSNQILCVSELLPFFYGETQPPTLARPIKGVDSTIDTVRNFAETDESIYSHLPVGESKSHEFDSSFPERLNAALKKLRLITDSQVVIQSIQHGSTLKKITFSLPNGLTLTSLTSAKRNIQTELGLNNISFEQGKEASTAALIIPNGEREIVYLGDIVRSKAWEEFYKTATLPVILGHDTIGNPIFADLVKLVHLLVCGSTGSGKSVFINVLLLILLIQKSPRELQLLCIDPKRVELAPYKNHPHVLDVITDNQKAYQALAALVKKMEDRYTLFEKKGYRNIAQYNKNEKDTLPYIVCIIDELADLIMSVGVVEDEIIKLAQKARASGIHLIIGTQRPQKEVLTGLIKGNIYSRACFACDSGVSYRVALDETPKTTLLGKGDGLLRLEGKQGLERFQAPLIALSDDDMTGIIEQYSTHWKGAYKRDTLALEQIEVIESDLDKMKRVIANTGETRSKQLQQALGVRNEKVGELMEQLIMEGWVRYSGTRSKGYEVIVSDEDRKQYLIKRI